jgi:predicted negative regulator of RcsB-dependent stress response
MPRQIIDTESSRPAYLRRRITTFVVAALIVAVVAAAGWLYWSRHAASPVPVATAFPGKSVR